MRVLITGAGVRIGRTIARTFAAVGHTIIIHYRSSEQPARELLAELGGEAAGHAIVQADLCQSDQLQALIPGLVERQLAPDCLINSAGTFPRQALREHSLDFIEETYRVNCFAPFLLMRDFANHVGRGVIINILDQRVATVNPDVGIYAMAKKSLRDLTLAAALDWAPEIRVNGVAPGLSLMPEDMDDDVRQRQIEQVPMRQPTAPDELANACRFLAEATTVTGEILHVDGGLSLTHLR